MTSAKSVLVSEGIRKYSPHSYRAAIGVFGEMWTHFFPCEKEAKAWRNALKSIKSKYTDAGCSNTKKRSDAIASDLPIGLTESYDTKMRSSGKAVYPYIRATLSKPHVKTFTASYGISRTREEAVCIVLAKRKKYVEGIARELTKGRDRDGND